MGTAVSITTLAHYALQSPSVVFAGTVLVAPLVDAATLVSTYSVAGTIPLLGPLAKCPFLFNYLTHLIQDTWSSKDRIAKYIRANEANGEKYRLTIIHAEDDWDVPWHHTPILFWNAVNVSLPMGISYKDLEIKRRDSLQDLGAPGSMMEWKTQYGVIREEILKTGLHDIVMGYPVVTMAVMRMFHAADPLFSC